MAVMAAVVAAARRGDAVVTGRLATMIETQAGVDGGLATWTLRRLSSARWITRLPLSSRVPALLHAAGWSVPPSRFRATKFLAAATAAVAMCAAAIAAPAFAIIVPAVAIVAYRVPDFLLARAARRRRRKADAELPQFLDLLAAASTAGLGPHGALRRGAGATSGPLREELDRFLDAVDLGARWRDQLAALAQRMGLPDLRRAVHAMVRTERLGSSLAEALRELADDVREERRSRGTEAARKAPVKMLFPLVFMILPAFLLLTVVPVLIATLRSIR